jgi:hypothetical protein
MKTGIFYNSSTSACSIFESGKMCYEALKGSSKYTLDYSEEREFKYDYDFVIYNEHPATNNWITKNMIDKFGKPIFCIVTEVTFVGNIITYNSQYFSAYILLDPTVNDMHPIYGFCRPLENFILSKNIESPIPIIGSFGFATYGKEWHKIVEIVQDEFDEAIIKFNIPKATYVTENMHSLLIQDMKSKISLILKKPNIKVEITHDLLTKSELIEWCSKNTINVFYYNREHIHASGLSAVTDQAISSGRPLLITKDQTFRHIHPYIGYYPEVKLKDAITYSREGVLKMKNDWSSKNFMKKFESLLGIFGL